VAFEVTETTFWVDHELVNNNNFYYRVHFAQVLMESQSAIPWKELLNIFPKSMLFQLIEQSCRLYLLIDCFDYYVFQSLKVEAPQGQKSAVKRNQRTKQWEGGVCRMSTSLSGCNTAFCCIQPTIGLLINMNLINLLIFN